MSTPPAGPRPGWAEHDALEAGWRDFTALAGELLPFFPAGERPAAVGVSGIGPCLLPAGDGDVPLRPALLYGVGPARAKWPPRRRPRPAHL
ncbi:hypothetical protein [Streptomyces enissocaesilis]|uniref:Uncharacterized protein n=1 Tax=Streptomyces enissocaesilis TaxID=332589 RepID=A0ABP6K4I3_9ACTN